MTKKNRIQPDNGENPEIEADEIIFPDEERLPEQPLENDEMEPLPDPAETETVPRSQFVRLQADFDNFRKRTRREQGEWYQRANENLIEELLPILDHFEMGLQTAHAHPTETSVIDGFQLVNDQLRSVLTKFGLSAIEAKGEVFDPHQHEAITYMPSPDYPAETVMEQTRRGYRLSGKLIRPAQVVVSSGPSEGMSADNENIEVE